MNELINKSVNVTYKENLYKLEFNNYSMLLLEDIANVTFEKYANHLSSGKVKLRDFYNLLYVALYKHHKMDYEEVVDIFDFKDMENILIEPLMEAFNNYLPSKKK